MSKSAGSERRTIENLDRWVTSLCDSKGLENRTMACDARCYLAHDDHDTSVYSQIRSLMIPAHRSYCSRVDV